MYIIRKWPDKVFEREGKVLYFQLLSSINPRQIFHTIRVLVALIKAIESSQNISLSLTPLLQPPLSLSQKPETQDQRDDNDNDNVPPFFSFSKPPPLETCSQSTLHCFCHKASQFSNSYYYYYQSTSLLYQRSRLEGFSPPTSSQGAPHYRLVST